MIWLKMAVLNPDHLLDQAERLIATPARGRARQVDLRRAISSSYYALFHLLVGAAADEFVGAVHRSSGRYRLVYRSIDHKTIAARCADVSKTPLPVAYGPYVPAGLFRTDFLKFVGTVRELQQHRHKADYDPAPRFALDAAVISIQSAREAMHLFRSASEPERKTFLTLLVCPPR